MSYVLGALGASSIDTATMRSAINLAESLTDAVKAFARSCVAQGANDDDARAMETEANNVKVAVFVVSGAVDRGAAPNIDAAVSSVRSAVSTVVAMAGSLGATANVSPTSVMASVQSAGDSIVQRLNSLRSSSRGGGGGGGGRSTPPPPPPPPGASMSSANGASTGLIVGVVVLAALAAFAGTRR